MPEDQSPTPPEILVAYSNGESRHQLVNILADCGFQPAIAESVSQAGTLIGERPIHLAFCEEGLPEGGYRELLKRVATGGLQLPFIVCGAPEQYLAAMWAGAFDYISPPYTEAVIKLILKRRREPRTELRLPVQIYGVDADGVPFSESVWTRNVSNQGALLEGVRCELRQDVAVGIRCHDREATFRVVWTARLSYGGGYEVGVESTGNRTPIWNFAPDMQESNDTPQPAQR